MNIACACRHLDAVDLYRTILLEEGCDLEAPRTLRPAPVVRAEMALYTSEAPLWMPRLRIWFGDSFVG